MSDLEIHHNPMPKTKQITLTGKAKKKLQHAVLERDNFRCQECFRYTLAPPHHVIFRSHGGSDTMENMITLCIGCHDEKH